MTELLKEAHRLHRLGFAILWLRPNSKAPVENAWTSGPRKSWGELQATYRLGYNVGVRLGTPSDLVGAHLAVLDVDVKSKEPHHRQEAQAAVKTVLNGHACPVVRSGRGGGSRHYYLVTEEPFKGFDVAKSAEIVRVHMPSSDASGRDRKMLTPEEIVAGFRMRAAWEVSLMSEGRQVVLAPSIHPDSGKPYTWKVPLSSITDIPVLEKLPEKPKKSSLEGSGGGHDVLEDFEVSPVDLEWLPIPDNVRAAIMKGTGVTDRSAYLVKAASSLFSAGLSRNEVLTVLTDPTTFLGECAYDHAKSSSRKAAARWVHRYTVGRIEKERSPSVFAGLPAPQTARKLTPEEQEAQADEFREDRNWRQDLSRTKHGGVSINLRNLDLILTNGVHENIFIEDTFASRTEYGVDAPWGPKKGEYLDDKDMIRLKRWLADTEFTIEPATSAIFEVTTLIADRCRRHPVREWLSSLEWDGELRINTWLRDYCRAEGEEPYLSEVSRKFLLAMITRVFRPGCQWDYILVLESSQGKRKSSMARALATDKWFMENLPPLSDKDAMLNLQGKWLIELPELADVKRADYNQVKAYVSRRVDTVRPHYGRLKSDIPRQSVFLGTVNPGQYFKDPTGNRRYWPVKVGRCDDVALSLVRDQLFAEAMELYKGNTEILMLSPTAEKQAQEAQEHRRIDDDESEMRDALIAFMESPTGKSFRWGRFKIRELMVGPNAPWGTWATKNYVFQNASSVLHALRFERAKIEGQRVWRKTEKTRGRP